MVTNSPYSLKHLTQVVVDVLLRELPRQPLQLQPLPFGHVKLGANLKIELEVSGPSSGNSIASKSKSGSLIAEKSCSSVTWSCCPSAATLDLIGHLLAKSLLDQLARSSAGTETGHVGRRHQLRIRLVQVAVDVFSRMVTVT